MTRRLLKIIALPLLFAGLFSPHAAYAACANPAGTLGEIFYNGDFGVMQFCDGTNWIGMYGGSGGGGGAGVTDGDKGDISVSGSGASWMIDDDVLDFTEFKDTLTLDASTDIAISGSNILSLTNTGTANSFVVNDQASDMTPFVIDAAGNVGIGIAVPAQALDVVGKATANSFIAKPISGAAAPSTGAPSAQWSTDGTHVWRATGNVGIGTPAPGYTLHLLREGTGAYLGVTAYRDGTTYGGGINLERARGTSGSPAIVQDGDSTGYIFFRGHDGSGFQHSAAISAEIDGAPGTNDIPGELSFWTTPDGSSTLQRRMVIDAAGNVGIGTTSPTSTLDVIGAIRSAPSALPSGSMIALTTPGGTAGLQITYGDGAGGITKRWDLRNDGARLDIFESATGTSAGNTRMTFLNGGNVGIGTTSPGANLEVADTSSIVRLRDADSSGAGAVSYLEFYNSTARTGWIGDGATGNSSISIVSISGSVIATAGANSCTYTSGASWSCSSDQRLKDRIVSLDSQLAKVISLRGVSYHWVEPGKAKEQHIGLIAQEVEKVYPELVSSDERGMKSLDYAALTAPLIEAVKELKAANDNLRTEHDAELKALRAEIEALKAGR